MIVLHPLYQLGAFAIGSALGSSAAVAVLRIPEDRSLWWPPSACPVCHTPIRWYDNIPMLSWLVLGGRCRSCGTSISPLYPLMEMLGGLVAWLLFRRFVPTADAMDAQHLAAFSVYLGFAWLMIIAAYTDLRGHIIPEMTSSYAAPVGVFLAWLLERLAYDGWLSIGWRQSVVGAAVAFGLMWLLSTGWRVVTGSEGLAMGDVKLMGAVGAFLGVFPGAWLVLLIASFLGAGVGIVTVLVRGRNQWLPFGPWIAFGALTYVLFGPELIAAWLPGVRELAGPF